MQSKQKMLGMSIYEKTDLLTIENSTSNAEKYCNKVLDIYVRPFAEAISLDFIPLDDIEYLAREKNHQDELAHTLSRHKFHETPLEHASKVISGHRVQSTTTEEIKSCADQKNWLVLKLIARSDI